MTNIRLGLTQVPSHDLSCMDWVVKGVKDKALSMSPIIIYCKSLKSVGKVFCYLKAELAEDAWLDKGQVGQAGRNGLQSHAILYVIKQSVNVDLKVVEGVIATGTHSCFRKAFFSHFEEHTSVEPGHLCCTYCHSVCSCASDVCGEPIPKHELLKPDFCIELNV